MNKAKTPPGISLHQEKGKSPRLRCRAMIAPSVEDPWEEIPMEIRRVEDPADRSRTRPMEMPRAWSKEAGEILAWKYARRNDPEDHSSREESLKAIANRLCTAWETAARPMFRTKRDLREWGADMRRMLALGMAAPNSPQWFNSGLAAYGLKGPDKGLWRTADDGGAKPLPNGEKAAPGGDSHAWPLASACFILKVEDNLTGPRGIMDTWLREARIFSGGAGAGANFSEIRSKGEPLSNGGSSSGLLSFLRIGDTAAGAIKSGGGTRRAAKMIVVDVDHPEVLDIIEWKAQEESKAAMLSEGRKSLRRMISDGLSRGWGKRPFPPQLEERARLLQAQGATQEEALDATLPEMDLDWRGGAYATVSGQNANISVRVPDEFMEAALSGSKSWHLHDRTDAFRTREIEAERILDRISEAAWASADPGIQFHDTINDWNTAAETHELRATNPCSEYTHVDESACNLASLNLGRFLDPEREQGLDEDLLEHAARCWTVALEATVGMAGYPTRSIAETVSDHRALGLGICGLGAVLMRLGIPYDSDRGRALGASAMSLVQAAAWRMSGEMSAALGPCRAFGPNRRSVLRVITKHQTAGPHHKERWKAARDAVELHGARNMQVSVIAPTGTIGILMDSGTTGIEPEFSLVRMKTLAGGGFWTVACPAVAEGLASLGLSPEKAEALAKVAAEKGSLEGEDLSQDILEVFDCAVPASPGGRSISPLAHVEMLVALQPFVSGAISKTVNLPAEATPEDIKDILVKAWKGGVKCISVYRDGSKLSQPVTAGASETTADGDPPSAHNAPPPKARRHSLPDRRTGTTTKVKINGSLLFLRTGEYEDGTLGEIFLDGGKQGSSVDGWMGATAQLFSMNLQHGVNLERILRAFSEMRFEPSGMVTGDPDIKFAGSPLDYAAKRLRLDYLESSKEPPEDAPQDAAASPEAIAEQKPQAMPAGYTGDICSNCGSSRMIRSGTCLVCQDCGETTGCA